MQALSATSEQQPFEFAHLRGVPGLRHGITRREGPGLAGNVAFTRGPDVASVVAARQRWCQRIGVDPAGLDVARQIHSVAVERVTRRERGRGALVPIALPEADALATDEPDVPLLAIFADCVPVVLVDPVRRAVAVAHAGWRGTVAGVVEAAVAALTAWYGSQPADLLAGIGPSIGPCCYEVGPEVAAAVLTRCGPTVLRPGPAGDRPAFDLWAANQQALQRAGLAVEHVATAGVCTRCHNHLYFSHRAEGPQRGLFGAIVALS